MPLSWDKPPRAIPIEKWKAISADSAPPGVYTPNMSDEDARKWKAKLVRPKTGSARVEVRKSFIYHGPTHRQSTYAQMLMVVEGAMEGNDKIRVSTNGPMTMSYEDVAEFHNAVIEARSVLWLEKHKNDD